MLKGIDPLLGPELLMALGSMGHGDELAVVDRNFPAVSVARRLVRLDGVSLNEAATAIFSVFPIDTFVDKPLVRMEVVGEPSQVTAVQQEFLDIAQSAEGRDLQMGSLERFDFYQARRGSVRDRGYRGATGLWQFRDLQGWALVRPKTLASALVPALRSWSQSSTSVLSHGILAICARTAQCGPRAGRGRPKAAPVLSTEERETLER